MCVWYAYIHVSYIPNLNIGTSKSTEGDPATTSDTAGGAPDVTSYSLACPILCQRHQWKQDWVETVEKRFVETYWNCRLHFRRDFIYLLHRHTTRIHNPSNFRKSNSSLDFQMLKTARRMPWSPNLQNLIKFTNLRNCRVLLLHETWPPLTWH